MNYICVENAMHEMTLNTLKNIENNSVVHELWCNLIWNVDQILLVLISIEFETISCLHLTN